MRKPKKLTVSPRGIPLSAIKKFFLLGIDRDFAETSLLKNAGVSEAVAMDIIGHDSKAISQHYTHIEQNAKRAALSKLPDLISV